MQSSNVDRRWSWRQDVHRNILTCLLYYMAYRVRRTWSVMRTSNSIYVIFFMSYLCIYLFIYLFIYLLIVRLPGRYGDTLTIWGIAFWFSSGIEIFLFAIGPWPFLESTQSCMIQVLGIFLWCKVCGAWCEINFYSKTN